MKITIFGTGYVGLVTGTCFSEMGNHVTCVDIDEAKLKKLAKGESPIYEPGLHELLERNIREKRLNFTSDAKSAVENAGIIFIAVGTPQDDAGNANLKYVMQVAETIGQYANGEKIIVTKSTVPVGTSEKVLETANKAARKGGTSFDLYIANNPEFLKEGDAIKDFMYPDRVVIGYQVPKVFETMKSLYEPFFRKDSSHIVGMDIRSSELTKYAANAFLATKISYINAMAILCQQVGADIRKVREGMILDPRIGNQFLYPGIGYGGSCFPKDVQALIHSAKEFGFDFSLLDAVEDINEQQKAYIPKLIQKRFGNLKGLQFAVWGLAFKPKTDDMRAAPSLTIIEELLKAGAKIKAFDPVAQEQTQKILGNQIEYAASEYEVLAGSSALIICTEWPQFRQPDFELIKSKLAKPVIFDGRNIFNEETLIQKGFEYFCIGKKY
jgi:UDPglucose 6-dehydrogenase